MLNSKFIKIIITILITIVMTLAFIFIQKSQTPTKDNTDTVLEPVENRTIFNTNTDYNTEPNTSTLGGTTNVNTVIYKEGIEDVKNNQINKILLDWKITKDPELLREALTLSESADNEAILESWRSFISTNSSDLVKIIDTSTNIQQTKKNIRLILQWYIELSGEYQKLSPSKKQEIMSQYNQLK